MTRKNLDLNYNPFNMRSIIKPVTKPDKFWDIILLILRIWLGYVMLKNGRSFFQLMSSEDDRRFFEDWFGKGLHFPFPLVMAYLAKGAEFFGGLLILSGLFTRVGASLVAFDMLVATLTNNLGKNWGIESSITISYCLFAIVLLYWGGGKYALESLFKRS
jgi:putative oxidoreductase